MKMKPQSANPLYPKDATPGRGDLHSLEPIDTHPETDPLNVRSSGVDMDYNAPTPQPEGLARAQSRPKALKALIKAYRQHNIIEVLDGLCGTGEEE